LRTVEKGGCIGEKGGDHFPIIGTGGGRKGIRESQDNDWGGGRGAKVAGGEGGVLLVPFLKEEGQGWGGKEGEAPRRQGERENFIHRLLLKAAGKG